MMTQTTTTYTIQEVSAITHLPSSTLRYYEEMGLLEPVERAANGHRRYTDADLMRISFVTKLRRTGMSIDLMRGLALSRCIAAAHGRHRSESRFCKRTVPLFKPKWMR